MRRLMLVAALACGLLAATVAQAQTTVVNPSAVTFTASADHADLTHYVLGYFAPGATAPVMEIDLGKPTPVVDVITLPLNIKPLGWPQGYTVKVKAIAAVGVESEWSLPSGPFNRQPGKPGGPVVK